MITCKLMGQMANQMFIIATTVAHARDNGVEYGIPKVSGKRNQFPCYFQDITQLGFYGQHASERDYREPTFGIYEPIPFQDNTRLVGYYQSEKYFKHRRQEIIDLFDIPKYPKQEGIVSIHVRRGDYVKLARKHPPVTIEYLLAAINQFVDDGYHFKFFSDDITWCKENFKGERFSFSEGKTMKEDMGLMASCEHNIIANSTFSWWGAWLNQNPDKIVIAPKQWFGPGYQDRILRVDDIVPQNWIKL